MYWAAWNAEPSPPNLESSESLPTQNRIIGGGGEHELVGADEKRSGKSPVDEEATVPGFLKSTGCTGHKPAVASVSLLAPVRNYGGGRELELAGADEHVCTTAAVMQQARDDEIACELGVNLHRGESCRRRKNFGACRRPAGSNP